MKKLLFALALACSMQAAFAQKSDADIQKALEKAVAASQDAKKASKPATWMALGKAYQTAYSNPTSSVTLGIDRATWDLMQTKEKPASEQSVQVGGAPYTKLAYSHFDAYFNGAGQLEFVLVTKPSAPGDLLAEAAKAYVKAFELGAKDKDVDVKLQEIVRSYNADAISYYNVGDYASASYNFRGASDVSSMAPCSVPSDDAAFNAALTAGFVQDYENALKYYGICIEKDYGQNGDVFARQADVYAALGNTAAQKAVLEQGFAKYPENQSILIGLINYAEKNGEDPNYVLSLLNKAKENDPGNASIYGVEGNILSEMKRYDDAAAAFAKALEVDPAYHYALYAWGKMWYERAVEFQIAADELPLTAPQREYDAIIKNRDEAVTKCIEPLEKCFNESQDVEYKVACAEYLRRAYYQLSNSTNDYKAKSESYKEYVEANDKK